MDYKVADLSEEFLSKLYEPMSQMWKFPPPEKLWQIGELPKRRKDRLVVSIVGSRHCTEYGSSIAYNLAKTLAERDAVVVSGMAYGIDSYAHRGCLDGDGQTVAVLGTPIDKLYPASNIGLARRIVSSGGAIISEYPPCGMTNRWNFVYRNRIVSGISDVLVIVEASEHSGTLVTAKFANEQGRSVYVVPGDVGRETSLGANRLIMDGANIFTNVDDMMDAVFSRWRKLSRVKRERNCPAEMAGIVTQLKRGRATMDNLAKSLKMGIQELSEKLSLLEIDGFVKSDSAGNWSLAQ